MTLLFIVIALAAWMGTFAGLLVCANVSISDFTFTEPGKDMIRSLVVAIITAGVVTGLAALTSNPRVFMGLLPVWYITVKLCWLEMGMMDMLMVAAANVLFLAAAGVVARKLFS